MGVFIYLVLTLFCGYMAFELGRYVIATGDALPIIIVSLLVLLSIHCSSTWNKVAEGLRISWGFRGGVGFA